MYQKEPAYIVIRLPACETCADSKILVLDQGKLASLFWVPSDWIRIDSPRPVPSQSRRSSLLTPISRPKLDQGPEEACRACIALFVGETLATRSSPIQREKEQNIPPFESFISSLPCDLVKATVLLQATVERKATRVPRRPSTRSPPPPPRPFPCPTPPPHDHHSLSLSLSLAPSWPRSGQSIVPHSQVALLHRSKAKLRRGVISSFVNLFGSLVFSWRQGAASPPLSWEGRAEWTNRFCPPPFELTFRRANLDFDRGTTDRMCP